MTKWLPVHGLEDLYEVSSNGSVRRKAGTGGSSEPRKPQISYKGYATIQLPRPDRLGKQTRSIHSLVAEAFLGHRRDGMQVNHIDGDKLNNNAANLEWVTPSENIRHAFATGLAKPAARCRPGHKKQQNGSLNFNSRLNEADVLDILDRLRSGESGPSIASRYRVSKSLIYMIKSGVRWPHLRR